MGFFGQELIYVLGYFLTLAVLDAIKKYGDIEAAAFLILGSDDYAPAFHGSIFHLLASGDGQGYLHRNFGKRWYIFTEMAIGAYTADILGAGSEFIPVCCDVNGERLLYSGIESSFCLFRFNHFASSLGLSALRQHFLLQ